MNAETLKSSEDAESQWDDEAIIIGSIGTDTPTALLTSIFQTMVRIEKRYIEAEDRRRVENERVCDLLSKLILKIDARSDSHGTQSFAGDTKKATTMYYYESTKITTSVQLCAALASLVIKSVTSQHQSRNPDWLNTSPLDFKTLSSLITAVISVDCRRVEPLGPLKPYKPSSADFKNLSALIGSPTQGRTTVLMPAHISELATKYRQALDCVRMVFDRIIACNGILSMENTTIFHCMSRPLVIGEDFGYVEPKFRYSTSLYKMVTPMTTSVRAQYITGVLSSENKSHTRIAIELTAKTT